MNKKRYYIYFTGIFERGYVRINPFVKPREFKIESDYEGKAFASKFRFKFMAQICCFMLSKGNTGILRTYKILEL